MLSSSGINLYTSQKVGLFSPTQSANKNDDSDLRQLSPVANPVDQIDHAKSQTWGTISQWSPIIKKALVFTRYIQRS